MPRLHMIVGARALCKPHTNIRIASNKASKAILRTSRLDHMQLWSCYKLNKINYA